MRARLTQGVTGALLTVLLGVPQSPRPVKYQQLPGDSTQLLLVVTGDWTATTGTVWRFERPDRTKRWTRVGTDVPVVVGRNGLAWGRGSLVVGKGGPIKKEGDGKSPAGAFRLGDAFGQAEQPPARLALGYLFLRDDTECVDDPKSDFYNRVVERGSIDATRRPDWTSSEKMRAEPLYRWGVVVDYNAGKPASGAGSCIFLHIWKGPDSTTAGCTAMAETDLLDIMKWLEGTKRPLLVQLPGKEFERLNEGFGLPVRRQRP